MFPVKVPVDVSCHLEPRWLLQVCIRISDDHLTSCLSDHQFLFRRPSRLAYRSRTDFQRRVGASGRLSPCQSSLQRRSRRSCRSNTGRAFLPDFLLPAVPIWSARLVCRPRRPRRLSYPILSRKRVLLATLANGTLTAAFFARQEVEAISP